MHAAVVQCEFVNTYMDRAYTSALAVYAEFQKVIGVHCRQCSVVAWRVTSGVVVRYSLC
jgi:hypothetical protein